MAYDMIIDSSLLVGQKIYADTGRCNDVPNGKYDLYSVLLHEFGHAIGLNHVNDLNSIMWFQQLTGVHGNDRKVWLHSDYPTVDGGVYMVTHSQDSEINVCGTTQLMSLLSLTDCDTARSITVAGCYNNINELNTSFVNAFPNPTQGLFSINIYQEFLSTKPQILIYNATGENIENYKILSFNNENIILDVGTFQPGFYLGRVMYSNKLFFFKFIKQ